MLACVSVCEATSMRCGLRVRRWARPPTWPAKVALNISVWRSAGTVSAIGLDVVDEAHVEHAIGFVEHQHVDVLEHGGAGAEVVEQATGGGDQDVERTAQGLELSRVGHAADDGGDAQALHVAAIGACRPWRPAWRARGWGRAPRGGGRRPCPFRGAWCCRHGRRGCARARAARRRRSCRCRWRRRPSGPGRQGRREWRASALRWARCSQPR